MGCGQSKYKGDLDGDTIRNREIDTQIKQDKAQSSNEVKIILLGSGESGKSTIIKQMKLIHEGSFPVDKRLPYKEIIFSNTIQSMRVILEAMEEMGISLDDKSDEQHKSVIFSMPMQVEGDSLPSEVVDAIEHLWKNENVLSVYNRSQEYQLNDSAKYFFDSIDRIGSKDYIPTDGDVLRARVKTTGISETCFDIGSLKFRMFDVGGQRSERKKWIHCFDNVMALIFMVALSDFNQVLIEDENVNRMNEALELFNSVCNSQWFKNTSIILFFNKVDLFKEKLSKGQSIKIAFPEYQGPDTFEESSIFLKQKFLDLNQDERNKQIYTHFTCATDTEQIKFVMLAVNDIIIQNSLRNVGLL